MASVTSLRINTLTGKNYFDILENILDDIPPIEWVVWNTCFLAEQPGPGSNTAPGQICYELLEWNSPH